MFLCASRRAVVWSLFLAACSARRSGPMAAGEPTTATVQAHAEAAQHPGLRDATDFEEARRGFIAAPSGQVRDASGQVIWDFDAFSFVDGEAPATVHPSLWRQARLNSHVGLFQVTEKLWQLRGFDLGNLTLIEGKTGWIVVDTLTARETAAHAMAFARRHLGDRKVSAVIFTHSHIDHFGGAQGVVSSAEATERAIPVVAPEGFLEEAASENVMLGPAMGRRSLFMYGSRLPRSPKGLVDDGLGKAAAYGTVGVLVPTITIEEPRQEVTLDGVRFVFRNTPGAEAPAELIFELPDFKAFCGAELLTHTLHNLHTPRGAKVRDAVRWSRYADEAMEAAGRAEVLFASHHWPVFGTERIRAFVARQRDVYRYLHDQTVRLINAGKTMREIADELTLPPSLDAFLDVHGYYGTVKHNIKAVVQHHVGWFDGNPSSLDALPPEEAAKRYVKLAGGPQKALAAAQSAFDEGDYRWAAELLNHLVFAGNGEGKELLARTYEQLGYRAESAVWRNFYLTGAMELREGHPAVAVDPAVMREMLPHAPMERLLDALATALNGPRADGVTLTVNLTLSDLQTNHVLTIENAVLHHREAPPVAGAPTVTLTKPLLAKWMTGGGSLLDLVGEDGLSISGSRIDLVRFFALLDRPPKSFAIVTPE